jgi:predicted lysophospholipase L1 biosynthesis ABC-type transport system permease subunit
VSESAARVLAPDGDALGASFVNGYGRTLHVVGVVADVLYNVAIDPQATVYSFAVPPERHRVLSFVVRTTHRNDGLLPEIQQLIRREVPAVRVHTAWWSDSIGGVTGFKNPRFQTIVLTSLGAVALVLTMVGIAGVVGCLVAARARELAVRAALGGTPEALVVLVVRQGLVPVAVGLVAGLVATRWARGFAEAQFFAVDATGWTALAMTTGVVVLTSLVAVWVPSRRVARIDPTSALKAD